MCVDWDVKVKTSLNRQTSTLVFNALTTIDYGEYICTGKSVNGQVSSNSISFGRDSQVANQVSYKIAVQEGSNNNRIDARPEEVVTTTTTATMTTTQSQQFIKKESMIYLKNMSNGHFIFLFRRHLCF
jgi:hypothetical protein